MAEAQAYDQEQPDLPPPGQRWGSGAQSVLPYLTKSLQARPAHSADAREARGREAQPQEDAASRPSA
ncbi:hypothetical protein H8N03_13125 [Ramlibacter sp. USB13]|uniref:Uncharacterized protein n=1 Tax=Ramlibacter cellulosilyticus TaxID=2764187 RepID=A0A923MUA9_9BURK|nr:hypothetical protein [Ramlibacter cellulosilyticus]MBC5783892.1 hypothetical protein [Ramlibacter cellulosilyticus]